MLISSHPHADIGEICTDNMPLESRALNEGYSLLRCDAV
jgi:hypothetical protein